LKGFNRLLGALVAVALVIAGLLIALEVAAAQLGHEPLLIDWSSWERRLRTTPWVDTRPLMIAILAVTVILLLVELVPRRPHTLEVNDGEHLRVMVRRRHLENELAEMTARVDGITKAKVRINKKRLAVSAKTSRKDPSGLKQAITGAVGDELSRFSLAQAPPISVRVDQQN